MLNAATVTVHFILSSLREWMVNSRRFAD
jgi:hypothetical protein